MIKEIFKERILVLDGVDSYILNPLNAWSDIDIYNNSAKELVIKFQENYKKYDLGYDNIRNGGPS